MYFDIVKSTYNEDMSVRTNSLLITGGFNLEEDACDKARELIVGNNLNSNEYYEVEAHNDNGDLAYIVECE